MMSYLLKQRHLLRKMNEITFCNGCHCMTKSIRKARATFICGKCGSDKTLGDIFQEELKQHDST